MEDVKKFVVEFLTRRIEASERIAKFERLSKEKQNERVGEFIILREKMLPRVDADVSQLKKILFSEPHLQALVLLTDLAMADFVARHPLIEITDMKFFAEKMAASVLDGIYAPQFGSFIQFYM